jgi:hypothetical protein
MIKQNIKLVLRAFNGECEASGSIPARSKWDQPLASISPSAGGVLGRSLRAG